MKVRVFRFFGIICIVVGRRGEIFGKCIGICCVVEYGDRKIMNICSERF